MEAAGAIKRPCCQIRLLLLEAIAAGGFCADHRSSDRGRALHGAIRKACGHLRPPLPRRVPLHPAVLPPGAPARSFPREPAPRLPPARDQFPAPQAARFSAPQLTWRSRSRQHRRRSGSSASPPLPLPLPHSSFRPLRACCPPTQWSRPPGLAPPCPSPTPSLRISHLLRARCAVCRSGAWWRCGRGT